MLKKIGVILFVAMFAGGLGTIGSAQSEIETEITSGTVLAVSSSSITISDSDEGSKITLKIKQETVYENIQSISEIEVGDKVYIDYVIMNQENVAVNIYKIGVVEEGYDEGALEEIDTFEESYDESEEDK